MSRQPDDGWTNPKVLTIFAVIFICGLVCGAAVLNTYMHAHMKRSTVLTLQQLQAQLHMTAEQQQTITKELDDYAKYYQNIEEERQSVADQGKRNMLKVLDPEQQKRFLRIFEFPTSVPCVHDATTPQ